jgi:hypothetical protein
MTTSPAGTAPPGHAVVVDLGRLRPQLVRGVRVFAETIAVPTVLPAPLFDHRGIRRLFTQVTVAWGVSRLLDAGMSLGLLHWGVGFGLVARPFCSGLRSAVTIGLCAVWALRALRRMGVTLRLRSAQQAA